MIRSNRPLSLVAATAVNRNVHDNRALVLNLSTGFTNTLPESTGSGAKFRFVVGTSLASGSYVISGTLSGTFVGGVIGNNTGDSTPATADFFPAAAGNNTFTYAFDNGAGVAGDWVEFEDIAADTWLVTGAFGAGVDPVSPFSTV